jgi:hypothetical protein
MEFGALDAFFELAWGFWITRSGIYFILYIFFFLQQRRTKVLVPVLNFRFLH